jgi:hypothetical protein
VVIIDEIRKKLQALDTRNNNSSNTTKDRSVFPFWDAENNSNTTIRFLPDGNEDNVFFWVTKQMIKLDFPGIKGGDENKPVSVSVPCIEMYDGPNTCPIQNEIRPWWKDTSMEELARKYWNKKSYIFHGFVQNSSIKEEETPENPIRRFNVNGQLFKIIKAALLDPDFENVPSDYQNGTDFVITKTVNGKWADYSTSKYARRESSLTVDQLEAIEKFGLADLKSYLPPKPTAEQLTAQFEMFEASVAGELYDPERWAKYYKPYGLQYNGATTSAASNSEDDVDVDEDVVSTPVTKVTKTVEEPVTQTKQDSSSGKKAEDIIAALRARKAQQG